jgi:protein-S-isoprenylcysteine O-methyltransferase Ste14
MIWLVPFVLNRWSFGGAERTDRRARWGILLQLSAYPVLWQGDFWSRPPGMVRLTLCVLFLALASLLSWTATRALGRHLRLDAAIGHDHELVRAGPYRFLRHPIYTSMFCVVLGTGALISPPLLLAIAVTVFVAGTEIRVRIEDRLLSSRFGDQFSNYQSSVSAYIPLLR